MGQRYSAWADWLDKFDKASEGIQALWILAGTVTVLGLTFIVMRGLVEVVGFWAISHHWSFRDGGAGPGSHTRRGIKKRAVGRTSFGITSASRFQVPLRGPGMTGLPLPTPPSPLPSRPILPYRRAHPTRGACLMI